MNIRYIYGDSGSGKSNLCIEEIYEKSKNKNKNITETKNHFDK